MVATTATTREADHEQVDPAPRREAEGSDKAGPGMQAVLALTAPTAAAVAAIFAAHSDEHAAIAAHLQRTFGNAFALEVVRAAPVADGPPQAAPVVDAEGPLGDSTGLDAGLAAADVVARGLRDENLATNEVFWQLYPALHGVKLKAGTEAAAAWVRVRDEAVRPALKAGPAQTGADERAPAQAAPTPAVDEPAPRAEQAAPATVHAQDGAGEEGIRATARDSAVVAAASTVDVGAADADLQALLGWTPAGQEGEQGEAAWLLAAIATGLVDAHGDTRRQLAQMVAGEQWIHSSEKEPGEKHRKKVDGVKRIGSGKYDIDVGDAPILGVLVALTGSRIREWAGSGAKKRKHLFTLGTLVRGDVGFGGSQHTRGNAIDLGGMNFGNDKDVLALLDGMPPGKVDKVFADNNDHVHVTVNDKGNFELGFPFQGNFFARSEELPKAKKAAEQAAGDAVDGATIHAEGMERYSTHWYRSTATFKDGAWVWKDSSKGKARNHLQSAKLKALLDSLDSGADDAAATRAAAEDGHEAVHHDQ